MKPKQTNSYPYAACRAILRNAMYTALVAIVLLAPSAAQAQLKIGADPTVIDKSAILELNSTQQGFLLPRLTSWAGIDALSPTNGMMVYYIHSNGAGDDSTGIYMRKNGAWQKVTTSEVAQTMWSRSGNMVTDGSDTLGTLNAADLKIFTNNTQRIRLDGTSGRVHFTTDTVSATGRLQVDGEADVTGALNVGDSAVINGKLYLKNVATNAPFSEVLVIDPLTGVVASKTIDTSVFRGWTIGDFETTGFATGIERRASANGVDNDTLILHAATPTEPGGVSVTTQEFAGNKTFKDSATVEGTLMVGATGVAAKGTLEVQGSVALKIGTAGAGAYAIADNDYMVLATANNATLSLPAPNAGNEGRIYIVKKTAADDFTDGITISGHIEANATALLKVYNQGTAYKFMSSGSTWLIIERM